jgi:hypothetical protein
MPISAFIILIVIAAIVSLISGLIKYRKIKSLSRKVDNLKNTGRKIKVDFNDCTVKTREYYEEIDNDHMPSRIEMVDALYDPSRGEHKTKVIVSVLTYLYEEASGKSITYRSENIYMPLENLRLYLETQKFTHIYIDPNNPSNYFFDLDFLNYQNLN